MRDKWDPSPLGSWVQPAATSIRGWEPLPLLLPSLSQAWPCAACLGLLTLRSTDPVKGLVQGSLNHEGSVMPPGAQSPRYLQTAEPAWQLGQSLIPSRAAGDRDSCSQRRSLAESA